MILEAFRRAKLGANRIVLKTMLHNVELNQSLQSGFLWFSYRVFSHFLPRHVVSSQRGASNCTQAPKAPPAPKVPEVPKAPGGFAGCFDMTETFPSLFWTQYILTNMARMSLLQHLFFAWLSFLFLVGTRTKQFISYLDAIYADGASCWWVMLAFHCKLTTVSTTEQNVLVCFPPCGHFQVELPEAPKAAAMSS